jgi:hypothetical protein
VRSARSCSHWARTSRCTEGVSRIEVVGDEVTFAIDGDATLLALTRRLADAGHVIRTLIPEQLTLEQVSWNSSPR